jgi:hypothetical protein
LRAALSGRPISADITDANQFRKVLTLLKHLIPGIVGEVHREWAGRTFDGIESAKVLKTGENQLELLGACCFLQSQKWTPIHIRLQLAASADEIAWFECRVGEREGAGIEMLLSPYSSLRGMINRLGRLNHSDIEWVYEVTFGDEKRSENAERIM